MGRLKLQIKIQQLLADEILAQESPKLTTTIDKVIEEERWYDNDNDSVINGGV